MAQLGLLSIFSQRARIDTWKCPRDQPHCINTSEVNWQGWFAFAILMAVYLLKDIIHGIKLILLSAKQKLPPDQSARFFTMGLVRTAISLFTLYVSAHYSVATATSNVEIIEKSVIILFFLDIDEPLYSILVASNNRWVKRMIQDEEQDKPIIDDDGTVSEEKEDIIIDMVVRIPPADAADNDEGGPTADSPIGSNQDYLATEDQSRNIQHLEEELKNPKTLVQALQESMLQAGTEHHGENEHLAIQDRSIPNQYSKEERNSQVDPLPQKRPSALAALAAASAALHGDARRRRQKEPQSPSGAPSATTTLTTTATATATARVPA